MRIMIGIKLSRFPSMFITVSMKLAEFCLNPYSCTHQSNDSAEAHTHRRHISQESETLPKILRLFSTKEAKKLRFRWQASQKCTFLLLSGVPEPHMPPAGGERSSSDRYPMRFKFSNTAKEELPSKQNTICTLK